MREKLELMSDSELIGLSQELNNDTFADDSIVRKIVQSDTNIQFMVGVLSLQGQLMSVLADRLRACSPHIIK